MLFFPVPVAREAAPVKLRIFSGNRLIRDLDVRFSAEQPDYVYFYPLPSADSQITVDGQPYTPTLSDDPQVAEWPRPLWHFTADGWLNDPNGCFLGTDGLFHLFFQTNPVDFSWGNMHWGHAVSDDLLHWTNRPLALFPDEMGTMFSGSAIIDSENVSGLGDGTQPPILLFYTAAGGSSELSAGQPSTQCLAYSTDGGQVFRKYEHNPVIPWVEGGNRDPKVFPAGDGTFVCALYLSEHDFALFRSADLLHWEMTQRITLPGDAECPDIYPLPWDGGVKWVLSGATGWYLTGDLRDGVFQPDEFPPRRIGCSADDSYASQTFFSTDGVRRRIAWSRWSHAGSPKVPYHGCMTLPATLSLRACNGVPVICANPIRPYADWTVSSPVWRTDGDRVSAELPICPFALVVEAPPASFDWSICGVDMSCFDNVLRFAGAEVPLPCALHEIRIAVDRFLLELSACDGAVLITRSLPEDCPSEWVCQSSGDAMPLSVRLYQQPTI